ncbi:hypothetical protein MRX96_009569 [Rhipicephalus microplus]
MSMDVTSDESSAVGSFSSRSSITGSFPTLDAKYGGGGCSAISNACGRDRGLTAEPSPHLAATANVDLRVPLYEEREERHCNGAAVCAFLVT